MAPSRKLAVLGLTSGSIVAHEVLLTRILSVTTWYTLAFAVLSLAMLGLTKGALVASEAARERTPLGPWIASQLTRMCVTLLAATAITIVTPVMLGYDLSSLASMLLVTGSNAVPMVAGASVVARLMSDPEIAVGKLYAVDLGAAALGALLPLAILGPLTGPSALIALAATAGILGALLDRSAPKLRAWGAPLACVATILVSQLTSSGLYPHYTKGKPIHGEHHRLIEKWNPLSYVILEPFTHMTHGILWGGSPRAPTGSYSASLLQIDGDAYTPIYGYSDPRELDVLRYDVTAVAHALRPTGTACVIGVGGGRDVLTALNVGHDHVLGIEINPAMRDILREVSASSPLLLDPRFEMIIGDGRAVLAGSSVHCSVLQASLIDTWAATGAGAFAHTEATLYTREAWSIFLRRVEPDGLLTFSRWFDPSRASETARLVALSVASLLDRGVERPRDQIAVVTSGSVATVLLSTKPFTPADLHALDDVVSNMEFSTLFSPTHPPLDPLLEELLEVRRVDDLESVDDAGWLDTSAPTDDRPFFFQLLGVRAWLHPIASISMLNRAMSGGVTHGNVNAMMEMLLVILVVAIVGAVLLGPTLVAARRASRPALPGWRASAYFSLLGAGFMLVEVALVQRMHVVLGHPTYALVVVLASLLVASGVGSALSGRLLRSRQSVSAVAAVAGLLLLLLPSAVIGPLAARTLEASLPVRASWTGGTAALVGLVLGMLFPSGLRFVSRERGTPIALALNGVASVIGGAGAVLVSVLLSIPASFACASLLYLLAGLFGPARWDAIDEGAD